MKEIYKNGCKTPAVIASELRKHGKLMSIKLAGDRKTELFEFCGECFEVLSINNMTVQVTRKDVQVVKTILACNELKFGGF